MAELARREQRRAGPPTHPAAASLAAAEYLPMLQFEQEDCIGCVVVLPAAQSLHSDFPFSSWNFPASQSAQDLDFGFVANLPTVQSLHVKASDVDQCPSAQSLQAVDFLVLANWPDSQPVHSEAPPEV